MSFFFQQLTRAVRRDIESELNSFPNYTVDIKAKDGDTYKTHFVALFSENPNAKPLLCMHGWPGKPLVE